MEFNGVKTALFIGDNLLVIQRDNIPDLRYPGMWDFVGGGREKNESPVECAQREISEELGIKIADKQFIWEKIYPSADFPGQNAVFLVAKTAESHAAEIVFGDEGQGWKLVSIDEFLVEENAVPFLAPRLNDYLAQRA